VAAEVVLVVVGSVSSSMKSPYSNDSSAHMYSRPKLVSAWLAAGTT